MLNHTSKSIARTDRHAAALSGDFGLNPPRDIESITALVDGAQLRFAVSIMKRLGDASDDRETVYAATLLHRYTAQLAQATATDMPLSTQQRLLADTLTARELVHSKTTGAVAKQVDETVYQQIALDWPADIVLPDELLRSTLGIVAPPAIPGNPLADPAMEQSRRQGRFMIMDTATVLNGRYVQDDPELCDEYIGRLAGFMLRDSVLAIAAEQSPQEPLSDDAIDTLITAYGATFMTVQYMVEKPEKEEALAKIASVMDNTGQNLRHLDKLDYVTRLHYATAFAERALVDVEDMGGGHKQVMQAAMMALGLDPHLDGDQPNPPNNPPLPPHMGEEGQKPQKNKLN